MTNSRLTDPEILEWRFPVLLESFQIRHNSGGQGQYHGGNGVIRAIRFNETMQAALISSHRKIPPYGLRGGQPGQCGANRLRRADGTVEELPGVAEITLYPGDMLEVETPGGGGFCES